MPQEPEYQTTSDVTANDAPQPVPVKDTTAQAIKEHQDAIAVHEAAMAKLLETNMKRIARINESGQLVIEGRLLDDDIWELVGQVDMTKLMLLQLLRNTSKTPHVE